jgi:hypothetical protein
MTEAATARIRIWVPSSWETSVSFWGDICSRGAPSCVAPCSRKWQRREVDIGQELAK